MPNTPFTHKPVPIVLLDIMARGTVFAKRFAQANPEFQCCCLCGTERFGSTSEKVSVLEQGSIRKVFARSSAFGVPSGTLDIVTLNDCDNLDQVNSLHFVSELVRTLKPGGLFISAHRLGIHPEFVIRKDVRTPPIPRIIHFKQPPEQERWQEKFWSWEGELEVPGFGRINYPASPTIRERLVVLDMKRLKMSTSAGPIEELCPPLDIEPSLRVWRKREE